MEFISMHNHDFHKQNLITTRKGDLYKCALCGASGYRTSLAPEIKVTYAEYKKSLKCTFQSAEDIDKPRPIKVLIDAMPHIGMECGIHNVVDCPDNYKTKFSKDVWVFSDQRKEAVRLLPGEFEIVD